MPTVGWVWFGPTINHVDIAQVWLLGYPCPLSITATELTSEGL
ncbi:uncharacterized protein METZ01_LOCUS381772, partial [marine metagenome]